MLEWIAFILIVTSPLVAFLLSPWLGIVAIIAGIGIAVYRILNHPE